MDHARPQRAHPALCRCRPHRHRAQAMKAALAAALLLSPAAAHAAPCTGPVCNFDTLAPYFARVAGTRPARGVPPVHILQIGDSHTAGDVTTAAWRDLLQSRVGDGGRGVLPPAALMTAI